MLGGALAMSEHEHRFELLADLGAMIAGQVELDDLLSSFADRVAHALGADRATLWLIDGKSGEIRSRVATLPELRELRVPPGHGVVGHVVATGELVNIQDAATDPRWNHDIAARTGYRTTSMLTVPVRRRGQLRGVLQVLNKRQGAFDVRDCDFALLLADQIGRALDYTSLRGDDAGQGLVVRGRFNHVIGNSEAMGQVYQMIIHAAAADATVLLHGETGTGKGLLARAIHVNSPRREAPFVHVDCTTLPAGLVESELFGHERGSYTGADSRVIGKVEAAAGGTLFLDEIGELPLPLQGKFLRLVQERQFERVGGRETLSADVRIVAATNRDLAAMAAAGQFRSDLYFRLRVIEIDVPPLRERGADDILALAQHFVTQFARKYRKEPLTLSPAAEPVLTGYPWPGNVRELGNTIERAVVMCPRQVIGAKDLGLEPSRLSGVLSAVREPEPGASGVFFAAAQAASPLASAPSPQDGAAGGVPDGIVVPAGLSLAEAERLYARATVERHGGNQSAASRALGIGRNKLARLLRGDDDDER
ncbi:MAG: sigma-54-dependent Fis family transcriptional regulator [Myxococcales bacterium]|nr:sigma-54-dependent Fis family transcriptional regulator [Myxococcales bacterium]